jgi:hypothetical protein
VKTARKAPSSAAKAARKSPAWRWRQHSEQGSGSGRRSWSPTAGRPPGRSRACATRSTPPSPRATAQGRELAAEQRQHLDDFWSRADIEVDGDEEIQQATRFATFHVLQAGARAEERALPAKGLTRSGCDGHAFWDTESFVLPMLTYTQPLAVRAALRWRWPTLPGAGSAARLRGSAFPWRTIEGAQCSVYWPAGSAACHVNADIADAVVRHVSATGDEDFDPGCGLVVLAETARMPRSPGHHDRHGKFHIDVYGGPAEPATRRSLLSRARREARRRGPLPSDGRPAG